MPGRVVPLLPQNAILELGCLGCSPIFWSCEPLPSQGLIAVAQCARSTRCVPRATGHPKGMPRARPGGGRAGDVASWALHPARAPRQPGAGALLPLRATPHGIAPPRPHGTGSHQQVPSAGMGTIRAMSPPRSEPVPSSGTRGTAGPPWPASTAAGCASTRRRERRRHQETLARRRARGKTLAEGEKRREKAKRQQPGQGCCPTRSRCCPIPSWPHRGTRSSFGVPGRAGQTLHPPKTPGRGGKASPGTPRDSPERGGGGGRAGSSLLARAGGARRGANFPGLMQDASASALAFCGFLGASQKSHNPTSCTFGFN